MALGVLLRVDERGAVHDVELDVLDPQAREGPDVAHELCQARLALKRRGRELHVEQASVALERVVELAHAHEARRGTVGVAPAHGRQAAVGELLVGVAAVGRGAAGSPQRHVGRDRVAAGLEVPSSHVGIALDLMGVELEEVPPEKVHLVHVVSVLGHAAQNRLAQELVALARPVAPHGGRELSIGRDGLHAPALAVLAQHAAAQGHERVGEVGRAHALHARGVVARPSLRDVLALREAVGDEARQQRRGRGRAMREVTRVAAAHHERDVAGYRGLHRTLELGVVRKALRVGGQRKLEATEHVEHRDVVQAIHAPRDGQLHAAHDGVVARVGLGHAAVHERADVDLVVEQLRQAVSQADDLAGLAEQHARRAGMHAHGQVGLRQARVSLDVEQKLAQLVGGVMPPLVHAAHDEVEADGKAGKEAGTLRGANGHDRVELEVEALDELADVLGRGAGGKACLVVGPQVLVSAAQRQRRGVALVHEGHLGEPHELDGIREVTRRLAGDVGEHLGDALELGGARRLSLRDELANGALIAADVGNHGLERDDGRAQEGVVGLCGGTCAGALEDGAVAAGEHEREVADDVSLALVGLRHGEDLVGLGRRDVGVEVRAVPVVERAATPVREEFLAVLGLVGLRDLEAVLRARGELVQLVCDPVGTHLGRDDARTRRGAAVSHDEVGVADHDLVLGQDVCHGKRPAHDDGLPFRLPPALRVEAGALERNDARGGEDLVLHGLHAGREHGLSHQTWLWG